MLTEGGEKIWWFTDSGYKCTLPISTFLMICVMYNTRYIKFMLDPYICYFFILGLWVELFFSFTLIRQLSEENANLQVYVEKESNEKKRLSRTNEELMWRLQTGELSPRMSPTQSPLHRPASSPSSPSRMQTFPRWVIWFSTSLHLLSVLSSIHISHHFHRMNQNSSRECGDYNFLFIPPYLKTQCGEFIVQCYFICWTIHFI